MSPNLRAALQRALRRRPDVDDLMSKDDRDDWELPEIKAAPTSVALEDVDDEEFHGLGFYTADPRICQISPRRIRLVDGSELKLIPRPETNVLIPDGFGYLPARPAPMAWRLFRPDHSTSAFWWPQLVDALADVLGPAQEPVFQS